MLAWRELVKGLAQEPTQQRRFNSQGQRSLRHYTSRLYHQARMAPIVDLLGAAGLARVMWFGASGVLKGQLTTGDMIVFSAYLTNFYSPMRSMSRQASVFTNAMIGAQRVTEVLMREPEAPDRPNARPAPALAGRIVFESVCFGYRDGSPVLEDISLRIRPGEGVAILGASGAGKSTIAALLLKFYDPQAGRILLDGRDLRDLTARSVRQQIGLVLQEPMLFRATVRDNIRFGNSEADEATLVEACSVAGVSEPTALLPNGLDTWVAERGKGLSGGQRQRLALARALVRQDPILLLDEPTSRLDLDSEAEITRALGRAAAGRRPAGFVRNGASDNHGLNGGDPDLGST